MVEEQYPIDHFRWRITFAIGVLIVLSMILFARVGYLQVIRFDHYQTQSLDNRLQLIPTVSVRGNILDRHGELLAGHSTFFDLMYYPLQSNIEVDATIKFLESTIGLTSRERKSIESSNRVQKLAGITIRQQLSEEHIARISAHSVIDHGLEITSKLTRYYPEGSLLGHLTGYIGKLSEKDWRRIEEEGLKLKYWGIENIGKSGLEFQYEDDLRGTPGSREVEVDAVGRVVRVLAEKPPVPGNDIVTTLDLVLQKAAHEAFGGRQGAMVALNPNNGEILVMQSESGYDPNVFIEEKTSAINELFNLDSRPMLNRAIAGVYPPASTFKPFVGIVGLMLGKRGVHDTIYDPGYFSLPGSSHRYRDWKAGGHGTVDFFKSLVQSVDTYYYGLAVAIGMDNLSEHLSKFGFGMPTGIDLPGERSGLLPSPGWKKKRFQQDWFAGDTVSVGVGQGYMLATPLQMAYAYSMIANQGKAFRPHLLKSIRDPINGQVVDVQPTAPRSININTEYWQVLTKALAAVNQEGGTGARAFAGAKYQSAGKTGTAQVFTVAQNKKYVASEIKKELHDHAWYVGFAPVDKPQIVVAAILENSGGGGANAAPLVRKVLDAYFKRAGENPDKLRAATPSMAIH